MEPPLIRSLALFISSRTSGRAAHGRLNCMSLLACLIAGAGILVLTTIDPSGFATLFTLDILIGECTPVARAGSLPRVLEDCATILAERETSGDLEVERAFLDWLLLAPYGSWPFISRRSAPAESSQSEGDFDSDWRPSTGADEQGESELLTASAWRFTEVASAALL